MRCFSIAVCTLVLGLSSVHGDESWRPILPSVGGNYDSRHSPVPPPPPPPEEQVGPDTRSSDSYQYEQPSFDYGPQIHHQPPPQHQLLQHQYENEEGDQCTLYKVNFNQDLYFQYIQYKIGIPDLKEFTLCTWSKFNNHSNDHPLFSYAVPTQPRAIYSWISNTERASYFSMSVEGHTFYRLNYPIRLNRWYHSCQSWNSNTGEWQIWVNAERVGRGFHNRLVGHAVPGGGIAITGQEQRQFGGGFLEGPHAPKGSGGLLGEVTMLHLYAAALAPGKAHKDHKHHHGQHHHHATTARPPAPTTPAPPPGFLVGNQIPVPLILNLGNLQGQNLLPQPAPPTPNPTLNPLNPLNGINQLNGLNPLHNNQLFFNPNLQPSLQQLNTNLQQLNPHLPQLNLNLPQQQLQQPLPPQQQPNQFPTTQFNNAGYGNAGYGNLPPGLKLTGQDGDLIEQTYHGNGHFGQAGGGAGNGDYNYLGNYGKRIFKREQGAAKNVTKRAAKLEDAALETEMLKEGVQDGEQETKRTAKRGIFGPGPDYGNALSLGGYGSIGQPQFDVEGTQNQVLAGPQALPLKSEEKGYPREPAEGEVIQIMNVCSGCAQEPFKKAEVISWRNTPKKLYSGAMYIPAKPQCRRF